MSLHILYIQLQTMKYINCIIDCNIVPYLFFHHFILTNYPIYTHLETLNYIKWNSKCNITLYLYFPHVMLLRILYKSIHYIFWKLLTVLQYQNCNILIYIFSPLLSLSIMYKHLQNLKFINSTIKCNIVPYSYFPHILSLHILYIQLQTVKRINCDIVRYSYFLMLFTNYHVYTATDIEIY
jgi:hypothetical protein